MSDPAFDLQAFLAEKAKTQLIQKAKDASQGFGAASSAIATLNVMMGTSLCPCCNKQVMLSTKCEVDTYRRYHMDLIDM